MPSTKENPRYTLEVCTASLRSVIHAVEGGAERIELCSALSVGGLTPSVGLLKVVRELFPKLKIHVLIRPREGNFVYSESEVREMEYDISSALPYADAIVGGAMTEAGDIDRKTTQRLITASQGLPFTFHRAFDVSRTPMEAVEILKEIGCTRLLTSGTMSTAEEGISVIRRLVDKSEGRIIILPGGGVTLKNIHKILEQTGATEIHGSASIRLPDGRQETSARIVHDFLSSIS